ncbi:MAG: OmpW family outer membrane protein [Gammaproteobacteria bacterium]
MQTKSVPLALAIAAIGLCALPAANAAKGDWLLRGGLAVLDPKSDNLSLSPGVELQVDSATSGTLETAYMLADHWGIELMLAYPFSHDLDVDGAGNIGEVDLFPPTLSLQYHFNPDGRFRPYIGAGVNYTTFSGEETVAGDDLTLDDSWGAAGQLGVDIGLNDNWFVNLAVRYIDMQSDAQVDGLDVGEIEIDPFMYQAQVGYRFGHAAPVVAAAPMAAVVAAPPPPPPPPPAPPADMDRDGVVDDNDKCGDTPMGERVGPQGCSCDVTRQVQFALNSAELTREGKATLDEVADTLGRMKFVSGTVVGHTDNTGSEAYNQTLSEQRAATVASYLEAKNVVSGRLATSGAGESQPIADNKTKEGRAQNRRVVLSRTDCGAPN